MSIEAVRARRLASQRLIGEPLETPAEVVSWLGAVQAQDYPGATWAIGLRLRDATAGTIEAAFNRGEIIRTHALRPTWHLLAPDDLRWVQALTAHRVHAKNAGRNRQLGLDAETLVRGASVITTALDGGNALTRAEIAGALQRAGIDPAGQRLVYLLMYAELETLICSGPMRGRQHTYALVDERVPPAPSRPRDAALAELAQRFFQSHGPVTVHDFAWWSGLTLADCREAVALAGDALERIDVDGIEHWAGPGAHSTLPASPVVHLLPNFDELYSRDPNSGAPDDREEARRRLAVAISRSYVHHLVFDGDWRGGWRREVTARAVRVELDPGVDLTVSERDAVADAVMRYGAFLGREAILA